MFDLKKFAKMKVNELLLELKTSREGLKHHQVNHLIESHHLNVLTDKNKITTFRRFFESLVNPFTLVLLLIAAVDYLTNWWSGDDDFVTIIIILIMILASSVVSFVQSQRSNDAAKKLAEMISNRVDLIRDGKQIETTIDQVFPGDIVKLSAGDMIPGDVRFIETKDLFIAQSALTGESAPVEKFADFDYDSDVSVFDLKNIAFMGTNVISGTAKAVVLKTGDETYLGSISESLTSQKTANNFDKGVKSVSKLLINFMIIMVPIVFVINALDKNDFRASLLFAISVAVGLTPEMLPVIMTSALARGAVLLSKKKVIVKSLTSIQSFGEMNVLCTDKTGTLTEDKVILEKYIDVDGKDDDRILRHAFLNSYFQTGLKNLLDEAVINRGKINGLSILKDEYILIDEIPFDFTRRRMSVILKDSKNKRQLISKGAVEEIISVCKFVELNGKIVELSESEKETALKTYSTQNELGLRVVAVAQKNNVPDETKLSVSDEKDMVLIGFIAFLDPPKESAKNAIEKLKELGVETIVLTGDSEGVAKTVCQKVGVDSKHILTGIEVDKMNDEELENEVKTCRIFAKLSPQNKERIVRSLQNNGLSVGFLGDGINDAAAIKASNVGISVDTAVDIAKETANIILLEKDLQVLANGVKIGRNAFGNILKYIKMQVSGNFGNMISVVIASIFLPFLPMLPVQILAQNLLCDFSTIAISFDRMDSEFLKKPRRWEINSLKRFTFIFGPLSSLFDILCFASLWWVFGANSETKSGIFNCGWFVFGTISQVLIMHTFRTAKIPFIQSRPAFPLFISSILVSAVVLVIGFSACSFWFDMIPLQMNYIFILLSLLLGYFLLALLVKKIYIKLNGEWL